MSVHTRLNPSLKGEKLELDSLGRAGDRGTTGGMMIMDVICSSSSSPTPSLRGDRGADNGDSKGKGYAYKVRDSSYARRFTLDSLS